MPSPASLALLGSLPNGQPDPTLPVIQDHTGMNDSQYEDADGDLSTGDPEEEMKRKLKMAGLDQPGAGYGDENVDPTSAIAALLGLGGR